MTFTITDANFDETVLKSPKLVVLDFWATWCGPCISLAPTVEEIAEEYKDKVLVGKVDIDNNNDALTARYAIRSIPTILFFKGGMLADKMVGTATKTALVEKIEALLVA